MIWLYCAVDDPDAALDRLAGTDGGSFTILEAGGTVPCVGRCHESFDARPRAEALREHDAVVRRMMSGCTVVPFRYHTVVRNGEEFHRTLDERASDLVELLRWLRGRVELAVRARCTGGDGLHQGHTGRSYLIERRACLSPRPLMDLHQLLLSMSLAATATGDGTRGMKGSYLIDRYEEQEFCRRTRDAIERINDISELSVTGPWPPYSFVGDDWTKHRGHLCFQPSSGYNDE